MQAVRYRTGVDRVTGRMLRGRAHLAQSIACIWATRLDSVAMLLAFGSNLRSHLAEDVTPALAVEIYGDLISAVREWEPEYRVLEMQLVRLTRIGGLGVKHDGTYYPEGRFGNYAIAEAFGDVASLARYEAVARARL